MYNSEKPTAEDLPSTRQLLKSTGLALVAALAILVTIVLPAEYGVDPTGIGRPLGLTEMGEIKSQLAEEAERDQLMKAAPEDQSSLMNDILGLFIGRAHAQDIVVWKDEISFTLEPGQGIEWKLVMDQGAVAQFRWTTDRGRVNFDLHGDGGGNAITYEKGRGQTEAEGDLVAAFDGNHGWFWRNRDRQNITVTLQLRGDYSDLKRTY